MEAVKEKGLARNIGISNFNAQSVMDLLKYAKVKPAVIQIELHPYLVQESLVWYCQKEGIALTGYSPLGASSYIQLGMDKGEGVGVLNNPTIQAIAAAHERSPAQVCLRWAIQRGYAVIPKSTHENRLKVRLFTHPPTHRTPVDQSTHPPTYIPTYRSTHPSTSLSTQENLNVFDLTLSQEEMKQISGLNHKLPSHLPTHPPTYPPTNRKTSMCSISRSRRRR